MGVPTSYKIRSIIQYLITSHDETDGENSSGDSEERGRASHCAHYGHKLRHRLQNKLWNPLLMQPVREQKTGLFLEIQTFKLTTAPSCAPGAKYRARIVAWRYVCVQWWKGHLLKHCAEVQFFCLLYFTFVFLLSKSTSLYFKEKYCTPLHLSDRLWLLQIMISLYKFDGFLLITDCYWWCLSVWAAFYCCSLLRWSQF